MLNALPGPAFALLLGWGWVAALVLGGVTWVSSSGVIAKVLADLGRLGNRETPVILSVLVIEDLAMALYLPLLTAVLAGVGLSAGPKALAIAVVTVIVVLLVALRYGHAISSFISASDPEALLLGVLGLTLLVAGLAAELQVSAAVGAFLVGIALSGPVAHHATGSCRRCATSSPRCSSSSSGCPPIRPTCRRCCCPRSALAVVTMGTKMLTGCLAAAGGHRAARSPPGRAGADAARRVLDRHRRAGRGRRASSRSWRRSPRPTC